MTMSRTEDKTLKSTPPGVLPLCVDLDGTLLHIDTLHESTFAAAFDDWPGPVPASGLACRGQSQAEGGTGRPVAV